MSKVRPDEIFENFYDISDHKTLGLMPSISTPKD